MTDDHTAYYAWIAADEAWAAELKTQFGKSAGDARYTDLGKGEAGSLLRKAHDAFVDARIHYQAVYNAQTRARRC